MRASDADQIADAIGTMELAQVVGGVVEQKRGSGSLLRKVPGEDTRQTRPEIAALDLYRDIALLVHRIELCDSRDLTVEQQFVRGGGARWGIGARTVGC